MDLHPYDIVCHDTTCHDKFFKLYYECTMDEMMKKNVHE
jgi:hypothetical protein